MTLTSANYAVANPGDNGEGTCGASEFNSVVDECIHWDGDAPEENSWRTPLTELGGTRAERAGSGPC